MSATGRRTAGSAPDASAIAATLREAGLVQVVAHADGAALAAGALLARAVADAGTAYQVSLARTAETAARRVDAAEHACVVVGTPGAADADAALPAGPAAPVVAFAAARELGADPDAGLALAGLLAAGGTPGTDDDGRVLAAAREAGVERRPGVGVPTADLADGLAHATTVHADLSGDPEAARAALAELALPADPDDGARRRVASLLALAVVGDDAATPRAAEAVEGALRPHATPDGPFETAEGYADVLSATARAEPGTGVALALGHGGRTAAVEAWREHARRTHEAVRAAETARYPGLVVARLPEAAPPWPVARLLRDYRAPEPAVLALAAGEAVLAGPADADHGATLRAAAEAVPDQITGVGVGPDAAFARLSAGGTDRLVDAVREAV